MLVEMVLHCYIHIMKRKIFLSFFPFSYLFPPPPPIQEKVNASSYGKKETEDHGAEWLASLPSSFFYFPFGRGRYRRHSLAFSSPPFTDAKNLDNVWLISLFLLLLLLLHSGRWHTSNNCQIMTRGERTGGKRGVYFGWWEGEEEYVGGLRAFRWRFGWRRSPAYSCSTAYPRRKDPFLSGLIFLLSPSSQGCPQDVLVVVIPPLRDEIWHMAPTVPTMHFPT